MAEFENLGGFLEHVSLVMDNAADSAGDMVNLMTLHSAKGLEFDTVFLPGWEEGLFPSLRSIEEHGLNGARGGTPSRLCRADPGAPAAPLSRSPPTGDPRPMAERGALALCRRTAGRRISRCRPRWGSAATPAWGSMRPGAIPPNGPGYRRARGRAGAPTGSRRAAARQPPPDVESARGAAARPGDSRGSAALRSATGCSTRNSATARSAPSRTTSSRSISNRPATRRSWTPLSSGSECGRGPRTDYR